jgi:hypothetical protein
MGFIKLPMDTGDRRGGVTAGFAIVQTQITRHRDLVVPSAGDRKVSAGLAVGPSLRPRSPGSAASSSPLSAGDWKVSAGLAVGPSLRLRSLGSAASSSPP